MLPPANPLDQFFADGAIDGAPCEEMLSPVDFRRFRKHGRAAILDQEIDRSTQGWICGDAGITVGATALKRQHDLGSGACFPSGARGNRQHVLDALDALVDGFLRSARRLYSHGLEVVALNHSILLFHAIDLKYLAAKSHHQCSAEIRMGGIAPLRAPQQVPALAIGRHATAAAMNEGHCAVDFRMVAEDPRSIDFFCNEFGDRSRAIH